MGTIVGRRESRIRRTGQIALVMLLSAWMLTTWLSEGVAADQYLCGPRHDYSCTGTSYPRYNTWANRYYGTGHNCTRYVAYRFARHGMRDPGHSFGNAYEWDTKIGSHASVNQTASTDSIAQWERNTHYSPSGHVAWVESVTSGYIVITQDNASGTTAKFRIDRGSANWPSHFLHPHYP